MIFQHTLDAVLDGRKTQTRRLVKPGEWMPDGPLDDEDDWQVVFTPRPNSRVKWQVSRTYAVQPGRGKGAVARIRITDIRQERVNEITTGDALAEGCEWQRDKHDRLIAPQVVYATLWCTIHTTPGTRWADNPLVWVLEFELVGAEDGFDAEVE